MAAVAAARRHYRGLTWLGRARRAGGAPVAYEISKSVIPLSNSVIMYLVIGSIFDKTKANEY